MRKLRFLLALAALTVGFSACTTNPIAPDGDCDPDIEDCAPVKPTSGS